MCASACMTGIGLIGAGLGLGPGAATAAELPATIAVTTASAITFPVFFRNLLIINFTLPLIGSPQGDAIF